MNNDNLSSHFKVKDFNAWRTSYNGNEKGRASVGITNGRVFRGADDQNRQQEQRRQEELRRRKEKDDEKRREGDKGPGHHH